MVNRIDLTKREDGYIISTVKSYDYRYGAYETAIMLEGLDCWNIVEGYETEEEAIKGHEKYVIVFEAWNGKRCEVVFGEEKAKERYWELDEIYSEVHLLKVEKEIPM